MNKIGLAENHGHRKPLLASHFLKALARINGNAPTASPLQRSCSIKRAAYASMARAAGSRRAWSRAVVRRLRGRRSLWARGARRVLVPKRVRVPESQLREPRQVEVLRGLVPGGKAIDLCDLLQETASYVQFLGAQVQLMQSVADSIS